MTTAWVRRVLPALVVMALLPIGVQQPAVAAVGEGTAAPAFTESWACGQPSTGSTYATRSGSLLNSELLRGYRGDFFGRSIGEVRASLAYWTVPMSGGYRILVHQRLIPALNQVSANLAVEQAKGNYYTIKASQTYGFSARTISGSYGVSLHAHGDAIDINTLSNPFRGDNVLITNMPDWFVQAWRDAGFCWGGDWLFVKDPQHFSWMGPAATPGYGVAPTAYPVDTAAAGFTDEVLSTQTPFGAVDDEYQYVIADGDGNGLADVFQLVPRDNGTRLEYSQTDRRQDWCSVGRDHALDVDVGDRVVLFGDYSRTGRNDVWLLDTSGEKVSIEVSLKPTGFEESITIPTLIPVIGGDDYLLGDHDRDGYVDLYLIHHDADTTSLDIFSGADAFGSLLLSVGTDLGETRGRKFTLGDTDLDGLPDLFVIASDGSSVTVQVLANGYQSVTATHDLDVSGDLVDVTVNDYDGDGRGDLWFWDESGTLSVRLGNTRIPGASLISWHSALSWTCNPESSSYTFDGLFRDDDGNLHETNIDFTGEAGIARGCNPPYNDDYCPDLNVTRGEMAAFLVRTFGLTDDGGRNWFGDDDDSVFEGDINRIATAGITLGCNPPDNDRFCPDDTVSRGEMAAFLVRGLG
ncbi:MAG: M15 family metallopeptidase, partial [Actinomycetota bacterium]|nr:M15 family metallopeptidase [Actinomycetota bacterium]